MCFKYHSKSLSFIVVILLLATIFSFSYHTKKENEYFENFMVLDRSL